MIAQYQKCALCDSTDIEKHSESHYTCKTCGLGTNGKPANLENHFKFIQNVAISTKLFYPELSKEKLVDKVQDTLHKVEKHPLDDRGFCQYCDKSFDKTESL